MADRSVESDAPEFTVWFTGVVRLTAEQRAQADGDFTKALRTLIGHSGVSISKVLDVRPEHIRRRSK